MGRSLALGLNAPRTQEHDRPKRSERPMLMFSLQLRNKTLPPYRRKVGANGWGGFYSKIAAAVRADALTVLRKFTF